MKVNLQRKSRASETEPIWGGTKLPHLDKMPSKQRAELERLSKMLPNPLTPEQLKDWLDNAMLLIHRWRTADGTNHKDLRKAWNRIGANARKLKLLIGASGDLSNVAPPEMRELQFVHEFLKDQDRLVDGLKSIEKWAGIYLDFLEKLARDRKSDRWPWEQDAYTLIIKIWVDRGGKPSVSADGPLATFLIGASRLILGGAPKPGTVPGIVKHAKARLKI